MNEFDLRKFLYNNPLLESEKKLKAKKKELEKQEDKLDAIDMKDEDAKEKAKHHKDAIKNVKKEIKDLEKDLKFDEKAEKKEKKEEKKKKAMKESLTKEGLKEMIRERITSILNEETIDEGDDYYEDVTEQEDVDVEDDVDVDVKDKEEVDVDVEKDVEVDDVSKETDIDVKTSLPGESEDVDAVLGLLTKASEEADRFSDDPELKTQIGNTITYFTRKHIASPTNEGEEVNELFGFGKKKRARSGGSDSKGFSMFAYGKDGGKRNIGSGKTAKEARRDGDFQNYRRRYAVDKFEVVNNDTGEVVDTIRG